MRTRYVSEVEALKKGGADEVNAEEFETSVEIFTVVLNKYFVSRDRIETFKSMYEPTVTGCCAAGHLCRELFRISYKTFPISR